jgi:hypothetical protein
VPGSELQKGSDMGIFRHKKPAVNENRFRDPEPEPRRQQSSEGKSRRTHKKNSEATGKAASFIRSLLDGSLFANEKVVKNLPFILFLAGLGILYIANSSVAEKNRRKLDKVTEELKELRYKYISTKSGVMYLSNPSQISSRLQETGIKPSTTPPVKIFIKPEDEQ